MTGMYITLTFEISMKASTRLIVFTAMLTLFIHFHHDAAAGIIATVCAPPQPVVEKDTINKPTLVRAAKDGSLLLTAENGKGVGPEIKYMPEWNAFGWFEATDHVEWDVHVKKSGEYEAYLSWSVSDEEAGKPFTLECGDRNITGLVSRTGSWETFKTGKIGSIRLQKGRHKVVFRPGSSFEKGGALLDLREIRLVWIGH